MGRYNTCCSVPGCTTYGKKKNVKYHRFPSENKRMVEKTNSSGQIEKVDRRKAWILKLKIGKPVSKYMLVCSQHFQSSDYLRNTKFLKGNAIPFVNLPVLQHRSLPSTSRRAIREECYGNSDSLTVCGENDTQFSGKPAALIAKDSPDWVPSVNMGYQSTHSSKGCRGDRYKRFMKRKRKELCSSPQPLLTNQGEKKLPTAEEELRGPKADFNSDDFNPLGLNNLLISATSFFQGMCKELELSVIMNKYDYLNLNKEKISLTTAGDSKQSSQFVIVNREPEDATTTFSEWTDDLELMLVDVEKTVMAAEKTHQEAVDTRTRSTQTDISTLEVENKTLKLEIAALRTQILSSQNRVQEKDVPKLLVVTNDE